MTLEEQGALYLAALRRTRIAVPEGTLLYQAAEEVLGDELVDGVGVVLGAAVDHQVLRLDVACATRMFRSLPRMRR